jgi:excisionase family DNA binding protein
MLYRVEEAADQTGIGRSKFYELMATGEIESIKIGTRRLIPHDALEGFVARLRGEAATDAA